MPKFSDLDEQATPVNADLIAVEQDADGVSKKVQLGNLPVVGDLAQLEADLASTANGEGASKVGVEDSGGHFTGTNVEAVLAELFLKLDGVDQWTSAVSYVIGDVVWLVDDNKIYRCIVANSDVTFTPAKWVAIGGTDSLGGGGLDVFHTQTFEDYTSANASGNNATFLGGGSVNGAESLETVSPIAGGQSWKYTAGVSSLNDYYELEVIDLDLKQRGTFIKIRLSCDMSNFNSDATFVAYDKTNGEVLTSSLDIFEAGRGRDFYEFVVLTASNTAQISYGLHFLDTPTNTETLLIDDIEFSTKPFVSKNLYNDDVETIFLTSDFTGSGVITDFNKTLITGKKYQISGQIAFTEDDVSSNTKHFDINVSDGTDQIGKIRIQRNDLATFRGSVPFFFEFTAVGTSLTFTVATSLRVDIIGDSTTNESYLKLKDVTPSEHVITPAKSNMTDWEAVTLGSTWSSYATQESYARRVGDTLEISSTFTITSTPSGSFRFSPHNSLSVDSNKFAGSGFNYALGLGSIADASDSSRTRTSANASDVGGQNAIRVQYVSGDNLTLAWGNVEITPTSPITFATGDKITFFARVPIQGWSSDVTFLAAVPIQKIMEVDIIADTTAENSTSQGITGSTSYQTINLNQIEGDTEFGNLSSNQITLEPGIYLFDQSFVGRNGVTAGLVYAALYNVTGSSYLVYGTSFADTDSQPSVQLKKRVEITQQTTFEYRAKVANAATSWGIYAKRGTITKIK